MLLGLVGTVIAPTGVWGHIVNWLELLGVIVPPIGAVLIVHRLLGRGREGTAAEFRPTAFAAWLIGAVAAAVAHYELRRLLTPRATISNAAPHHPATERRSPRTNTDSRAAVSGSSRAAIAAKTGAAVRNPRK